MTKMKRSIPEMQVFTFNNRAEALAMANDCVDDCIIAACFNHRTNAIHGRKGTPPQIKSDLADVPCTYMVVNKTLIDEFLETLKEITS
jgi:hypothetical protein